MRIYLSKCIAIVTFTVASCFGQGIITTVPGSATCCTGGPTGIARDTQGNLYLWVGAATIRKLTPAGVVTTVAGTTAGYSGDGGPATQAQVFGGAYSGLALDATGNLYVSDSYNHAIRMINAATGIITTIVGNGTAGFAGDGGPAAKAQLNHPIGIAVDSAGNIYIADQGNNRVRKVNTAGVISTYAGNGNISYSGDGVQANTTAVVRPQGLTLDSNGNLYISETDQNRIRKVTPGGGISRVAGQTSGNSGFSGDGGLATAAFLFGPLGMAADPSGNLFFSDNQNSRIRKIDSGGIISTYAGISGNSSTPLGDGGPATSAYLSAPIDMVLGPTGILYLTDSIVNADCLRQIAPGAAGLVASPASLTFTSAIGGAAPASQSLSISITGAAVSFSALASTTTGSNWLSVSPASGTTPGSLTVAVNTSGLSTGTYQGLITLTPSTGSPLAVGVTLTVTGAGAPTITPGGIVNASGYQTTLAPDTVFVIFGSNMGPATLASAAAPSYPSSLSGTSITFTPSAGGSAIPAKLIYTSAGQIAGLLPSSITPGTYAVKVTYNSQTSAPQNVTVVPRSFGIATSNSAGTGPAQATIGNVNGGLSLVRLTSGNLVFGGYTWTLTAAHPGDTLVIWGTGGGADAANDSGGTSGDQTAAGNFSVNVDGTAITPVYAGASSGYPGLWQINFTLPATIAADCFASLQVSAGGQLSNLASISIAPIGQTSCTTQISTSTLATLDSGGNIVMAGLAIGRTTVMSGANTTVTEYVGGVFNRYTASEFLLPYSGPKFGACTVLQETYAANAKEPSGPDALLDAGTLKVSGPGTSQNVGVFTGPSGPAYNSPIALQNGGTYTLSGAGGAQVGPFTATATMPSSFTVTNLNSLTPVNRAQGLTINWTGSGFDQIIILIQGDILTSTTVQANSVSCAVPASPGTFTVPAAALAYLPAVATGTQNVAQVSVTAGPSQGGIVSAESGTSTALTPNLVAGGQVNFGAFTPFIAYSISAAIQ